MFFVPNDLNFFDTHPGGYYTYEKALFSDNWRNDIYPCGL